MSSRPKPVNAPDIVSDLLLHYESGPDSMKHVNSYELPSQQKVVQIVERCRALIFPGWVGESLARTTRTELRDVVQERVDEVQHALRRQLYRGLHHKAELADAPHAHDCPQCAQRAGAITEQFMSMLVPLRELIARDVDAAYRGDPAATGTDEIIVCYPGLYAISVYRIANALLQLGAKIIPRIMTESAHEKTGIDIHPGATIGESFFIDHGTGVVIGETTLIGDRVRIYQGVTLGALSVPFDEQRPQCSDRRHPIIEDDVVIYAGATILGGDTCIGKGAVIGGNCWVTSSVPPNTKVTLSGRRPSEPPE